MVDAKLYGFVNLKVKKEVADKINEILNNKPDIKISELLLELVGDKKYVTIKIELIEAKKTRLSSETIPPL